ncbi:30S ribosomal protein S8 [Oceanococcus atlanticus]|uniref:Small ribosomal subunit protein uS8 n=1 Tax=Oceanococcus atlanticus TaxID=1317117 RepID=A0A1Y1SH40_9GAMM|nr:30S ribosomal protein S8 [Oceanococcus atlanticus]ORE88967.1 30S ribosomal protein S8 [Oceanococcus atlanticus]RZO83155.1 MAG: 30S ribosomal protein S8 [Oceanococcus sp.]
MSMTDPISDMLTRIRNGQAARLTTVSMPSSKVKKAIAQVLLDEGYISAFNSQKDGAKETLNIELKYFQGKPVIDLLQRVSKPSLRIYKSRDELPQVLGGLGVAIVSTSTGVMADRQARANGQGGEVLCIVA